MGYAKRTLAVLTAVGIAASATLLAVPSASAAGNGDWAAYPKRPDNAGTQFTPRQYFFFDVSPDSEVKDVVTIKNSKRTPLTLALYPADAFNVRTGGGFALKPRTQDQTDVGSWVQLSVDTVTVPAAKKDKKTGRFVDGTANVPFTMKVPKNATPGDHAGGIVTLEPEPSSTVTQPTGAVIGVRRSLAVRIYTRVSGPLNPQLLVSNVRYVRMKPAVMPFLGDQGGATIEYTYVNNGNVRITPDTTITYKGFLGRTIHNSGTFPSPEILPGQTITLTDTVQGMPVLDQITARVQMQGNGNADRALAGLTTAGDAVKWAISWIFVAVVIALIVAFVVWRRLRSRRAEPSTRGKRAKTAETMPV